nr:MAG TPA: Single-strand binding protein strand beta-sheet extended loops.85A [Caudoviricetes sp.]
MSEMNISGKVVQVLPIQTGTSKAGNPWQKQEFVLEQGGQYPRKVCISLFGDNVAKIPQVGQDVMVSVDIDSREFNGRWYTEIKAWNITQTGAQQAAPAPQQVATAPAAAPAQPQPAPQAGVADDLPF